MFQSAEARRRDLEVLDQRLAADRLAGVLRRLDTSLAAPTMTAPHVVAQRTSDAEPTLHPGALTILRTWRLRVDTSGLRRRLSSKPGSAE